MTDRNRCHLVITAYRRSPGAGPAVCFCSHRLHHARVGQVPTQSQPLLRAQPPRTKGPQPACSAGAGKRAGQASRCLRTLKLSLSDSLSGLHWPLSGVRESERKTTELGETHCTFHEIQTEISDSWRGVTDGRVETAFDSLSDCPSDDSPRSYQPVCAA